MRTPLGLSSLIAVVALAACQPSSNNDADTSALPPPTLSAADAALLQPLVVATNEPFWQLEIQGQSLRYSGVDQDRPRQLQLAEDQVSPGQRRIVAIDAIGRIEVEVLDQPCTDSMSGGQYPFTARVAVGGDSAVHGCARPASMPPPGEGGQ
jgi:uncharacterized membrane protein